jgi:hypothetical protein
MDAGSLSKRKIPHENGRVSGNGMTRIDVDGAKSNSDISGYIPMDVNGTERAGYITYRFSLGDGYVRTEAGAIVIAVPVLGKAGESQSEGDGSQKGQPGYRRKVYAHEQPRVGVVYAAELLAASLRQESSSSECYP